MHGILQILTFAALANDPQPSLTASPRYFDIQPLQGERISGELVGWKGQQVTVKTDSGSTSLDTAALATMIRKGGGNSLSDKPAAWIELTDGSQLVATDYAVAGVKATIKLCNSESLEVPTAEVASVRFQKGSEAVALEWSRILRKKLSGDVLVTANLETVDYHQGMIHDVSDKLVQFELDGETLKVKRPKIYGIIYYHADAAAASDSPYTITDTGGSRWSAASVQFDDGKFEWIAASGRKFRRDAGQISQIDLSCGKIVYLSDIKADVERFTPFFATAKEIPGRNDFHRVRRDVNLEGKSICIKGRVYNKGIAMHSRSELAWTLPGKFSRLEGVAGIDDDVRPQGNVRLQILGDGKMLLDKTIAANSSDAHATPDPLPFNIDLIGVRRLVIIADFGENLDIGDHLDLGNLRLIK